MKLSELKPCAACGGPLLSKGMGTWYVVHISQAMLNARAANQVLAINQYFNGNALGLAEMFVPGSDDAVMIFGEKQPELWTKAHICMECGLKHPVAFLIEAVNERQAKQEANAAG